MSRTSHKVHPNSKRLDWTMTPDTLPSLTPEATYTRLCSPIADRCTQLLSSRWNSALCTVHTVIPDGDENLLFVVMGIATLWSCASTAELWPCSVPVDREHRCTWSRVAESMLLRVGTRSWTRAFFFFFFFFNFYWSIVDLQCCVSFR